MLLPPAQRPAWPLAHFRELYRGAALLPVAGYVLCWVWFASANSGEPHPLPFLPLANPLDLASACGLLAVLRWWREARGQESLPMRESLARALLPKVAATGFLWLNVAAARAVHALAGVGYSTYWLHRSAVFQGTISVLTGKDLRTGRRKASN